MFTHNQKNKSVIAALLALSMVTLFSGVLFFRQEVADVRLSIEETYSSTQTHTENSEEAASRTALLTLLLLVVFGFYASTSARTPFAFRQIASNVYSVGRTKTRISQPNNSWPIRGPSL